MANATCDRRLWGMAKVSGIGKSSIWPLDELEDLDRCPVCVEQNAQTLYAALEDRTFQSAPGKWTLVACDNCGSVYLNPRPDRDSIGRAYERYYTHVESTPVALEQPEPIPFGKLRLSLRNGYWNARYDYSLRPATRAGRLLAACFPVQKAHHDQVVRHLVRPMHGGRLLDVGCGNGSFINTMRYMGWSVQGVEPDPNAAKIARRSNLNVHPGDLSSAQFEPASFDAITLNHVIEHVHEPVSLFRECRRILRAGALLWVATPNLMSFGHRYFRRDWMGLDPPRHLVLFTPRSLKAALERAGFQHISSPNRNFRAPWYFEASWAIRHLSDDRPTRDLPFPLSMLARWANMKSLARPSWAEEIVLIARKD
jgi:2-polyprenyl-3-methyl-5-hydroxy-6-metoxy-1,4-benzoquinol methylase